MRITCPSCAAIYDVPDERLAPGRTVKCAQCGTGWAPVVAVLRTAAEPVAAPQERQAKLQATFPPASNSIFERLAAQPAPVEAPAPKPVPPPKPVAPPPEQSSTVVMGWVASIGLLLLLAGAAYAWRAEIVQAWPASERGYVLLGIAPR